MGKDKLKKLKKTHKDNLTISILETCEELAWKWMREARISYIERIMVMKLVSNINFIERLEGEKIEREMRETKKQEILDILEIETGDKEDSEEWWKAIEEDSKWKRLICMTIMWSASKEKMIQTSNLKRLERAITSMEEDSDKPN